MHSTLNYLNPVEFERGEEAMVSRRSEIAWLTLQLFDGRTASAVDAPRSHAMEVCQRVNHAIRSRRKMPDGLHAAIEGDKHQARDSCCL